MNKSGCKAKKKIFKFRMPVIITMFKRMPQFWEALLWISLASLAINILSLVIPMYFMQVYDRIIKNTAIYTLIWITGGAVVAILLDAGITIIRGILSSWYASTFAHVEGMKLMEKLFKLTKREFNKKTGAEHEESFRAISTIQRFYAGQLFQSFLDIPFIFIFLGSIYLLAGKLVYFHISVLLLYLLFIFIYQFVFKHFRKKSIDSNSARIGFLTNLLKNIHPIKAQAFEEMLLRKLDVYQSEFSFSDLQMRNKSSFPAAFGEFLSQLMIYGTIVIGGVFVIKGGLSLGVLSAATMLARRTVAPLISLSRFSLSMSEANIGFEKIDFQSKVPELDNSDFRLPDSIEGYLEFRNLSLDRESIGGRKLDNINLKASKGKIISICCEDHLSTDLLVDALIGVEKPDSGTILLDDFMLSKMNGLINLPEVAILPRKGKLFSGTILENITLFNPNLTVVALDAAAFLGLNPLVANLPAGYETEIGDHSNKVLPSGLIQRISIARAFVFRPRVIVSNQADGVMDEDTLNQFIEIMVRIRSNTTIILLTESPALLKLADEVYFLRNGKLELNKDNRNAER